MRYSLRISHDKQQDLYTFPKIVVTASGDSSDGDGRSEILPYVGARKIARPPVDPYQR